MRPGSLRQRDNASNVSDIRGGMMEVKVRVKRHDEEHNKLTD